MVKHLWRRGSTWILAAGLMLLASGLLGSGCSNDECICDAETELCVVSESGSGTADGENYVCADLPDRCDNDRSCGCVEGNYPDCTCSVKDDGLIRMDCP